MWNACNMSREMHETCLVKCMKLVSIRHMSQSDATCPKHATHVPITWHMPHIDGTCQKEMTYIHVRKRWHTSIFPTSTHVQIDVAFTYATISLRISTNICVNMGASSVCNTQTSLYQNLIYVFLDPCFTQLTCRRWSSRACVRARACVCVCGWLDFFVCVCIFVFACVCVCRRAITRTKFKTSKSVRFLIQRIFWFHSSLSPLPLL